MSFIRTTLVHHLSRFLMFALLFTVLGGTADDIFDPGHGGEFQKIAVMVCDEPADTGDTELFLTHAAVAPPSPLASGSRPVFRKTMPLQAIYAPPPRPPAFA